MVDKTTAAVGTGQGLAFMPEPAGGRRGGGSRRNGRRAAHRRPLNTRCNTALPAPAGFWANLAFFLANHEEQAVERLARDVACQVAFFGLEQAKAGRLAGKGVVLLGEAHVSVALFTTGKKRSDSGARVLVTKNSVTDVSPPVRMFWHRSRSWTARPGPDVLPSGTAASAARLMEVTSSSMRLPWPMDFMTLAASSR